MMLEKTVSFFRNRIDFLLIVLILIFSLIIRIYLLDKIPPNLTGDESWDLSNVYTIVFGSGLPPFTFLGDGSVSAIIFYPVAYLIKLFGPQDSYLFLRFNIVIYSLFALVGFYLVLKRETSRLIAFLFTFLLSANYVFLNFSRTAWVNMVAIFTGIFLILFAELAVKEKKTFFWALAGIFGGLSVYAYHYGRILLIFVIFYFLTYLIINRFNFTLIKGILFFLFSLFIVVSPFLISIDSDNAESVLRRPNATFAFSQDSVSSGFDSFSKIFFHQTDYTIRGFILLDGSVMNEGVENSRYLPKSTPPVNLAIKFLFIGGLVYFIVKKKFSIWLFVFASILLTQFLSILPPNYSRGLLYIPFIYFISGVFIYNILIVLSKRLKIKKYHLFFYAILSVFALVIISYDINKYFTWMKNDYIYNARQPGISYEEFPTWQNFQIERSKKGLYPITNQEWYKIRTSLIR